MSPCSVGRHAELEPGQAERLDHTRADEVAEVGSRHPLDQLGQHPVRRGRVVLEARARAPSCSCHFAKRASRRSRSSQSSGENGARGKPDVCSMHLLDRDRRPCRWSRTRARARQPGATRRSRPRPSASTSRTRRRAWSRRRSRSATPARPSPSVTHTTNLPCTRERELARRNVTFVDLALRARDQVGERVFVDPELGRCSAIRGEKTVHQPLRAEANGDTTRTARAGRIGRDGR